MPRRKLKVTTHITKGRPVAGCYHYHCGQSEHAKPRDTWTRDLYDADCYECIQAYRKDKEQAVHFEISKGLSMCDPTMLVPLVTDDWDKVTCKTCKWGQKALEKNRRILNEHDNVNRRKKADR